MDDRAPWDYEIAFYTDVRGIDSDKARTVTILRWMWHGDLRPLEAAIVSGQSLDQSVLNLLADMISGDTTRFGSPPPYRVTTASRRRGRPKAMDNFGRSLMLALQYQPEKGESDAVFERIASVAHVSQQTVRQAVTSMRKAHKSNK